MSGGHHNAGALFFFFFFPPGYRGIVHPPPNDGGTEQAHLSFKDTFAQHRQQLASTGTIQLTMHGAATPVTLPISTVASNSCLMSLWRASTMALGASMFMGCLLMRFHFEPEYTVASEYRRCSGSNQVRSVPPSSGGDWTIPLYPKKNKKKMYIAMAQVTLLSPS